MAKLHKNQAGVAHVAVLLIVFLLAAVGFAGYRVWKAQDKKTEIPAAQEVPAAPQTASEMAAKLREAAAAKFGGGRVTVGEMTEGYVNFKAGDKDFYTGVTEPNAGFGIQVEEAVTADARDEYVVGNEIVDEMVNVAKTQLGLTPVSEQLPELLGFFANNYLENDNVLCAIGSKDALPVNVNCASKQLFTTAATELEPFAAAVRAAEPEFVVFVGGVEQKDGANGYKVAQGSVSNARGFFYQNKKGTWVFMFGTQEAPGCDSFEKDPEAAKAYEGTACLDYENGAKERTVES